MVPHASIISESASLCLQCSPSYTAVLMKNCSKSMSVIKQTITANALLSLGNPSVQPPTSTDGHFDITVTMTATEESSHINTIQKVPTELLDILM